MEIVAYNEKHSDRWSEFVKTAPTANISHEIEWAEAMRTGLGHQPRYLFAESEGKVRAVLPLFLVRTWWGPRYLVSIPWFDYGGVCSIDAEATAALVEGAGRLARDEKAEFVELRSIEPTGCELAPRRDKVTFLLPLDKDPEKVRAAFSSFLRNRIRKSVKCGLTTELGGAELLDEFYAVFSRNMRDLGTPVWGKSFFSETLRLFPNNAEIILVRSGDQTVAAGMALSHRDRMHLPAVSALRSSRKLCPNQALYWRLISEACQRGLDWFDFGRSSWDSNTFEFKKKWFREPTQLHWEYHLERATEVPNISPSNLKYRMMIATWRKLPLGLANFLGPRVIRNFP